MLVTWPMSTGLNAGLSFWLPLDDLGGGQVSLVPNSCAGSPTASFARATSATTFDVTGAAPILVNSGVARSYYDPVAHGYFGYLAEEARTNLLLNSPINGTNLSTQSVTVAAVPCTLSFYGTGSVVLSGTFSGTLAGSGAYPTRSTLTFTPTAGTLTLTVSGTVQYAQLEAGSFATSFIPTAGVAVARNADVLTYPNAGNMDGTQGACYAEATSNGTAGLVAMFVGTDTNGRLLESSAVTNIRAIDNGAANIAVKTLLQNWAVPGAAAKKIASTWGGTTLMVTSEGQTPAAAASFTSMSTANPVGIGNLSTGGNPINGTLKQVHIWTRTFAASQLATLMS